MGCRKRWSFGKRETADFVIFGITEIFTVKPNEQSRLTTTHEDEIIDKVGGLPEKLERTVFVDTVYAKAPTEATHAPKKSPTPVPVAIDGPLYVRAMEKQANRYDFGN